MKCILIKNGQSGKLTESDALKRMNDVEKKLYYNLLPHKNVYLCETDNGFEFCDGACGWGESYLYFHQDKIIINVHNTDLWDYGKIKADFGLIEYNKRYVKAAVKKFIGIGRRGEEAYYQPINAFYGRKMN